jgi:hypothetical protein
MPLCKSYVLGKRVPPRGLCPLGLSPKLRSPPVGGPLPPQTQAPSVAIQYSLPLLPSLPVPCSRQAEEY